MKLPKAVKIWVHSDQHIDVIQQHLRNGVLASTFSPPIGTDLIISAGDTREGVSGIQWLDTFGIPAIYVAGNHEHYRLNLQETEMALRYQANQSKNVRFLNNDRFDFGKVRILGTTLWTDYRLEGNEKLAMSSADAYLMDHRLITTTGNGVQRRLFTPLDAQNIHFRSRQWLEEQLEIPHDGPTIVVTHHAPHINSVHPMYLGTSPINACFASDLSDILRKFEVDLWVHGHTHWAFDYEIFGTRVVCNPYGYYPSREIEDFDPELLITIG